MGITVAQFHSMYRKAAPDECWVWLGAVWGKYGGIHVDRRWLGAHVVSWALANGRWPADRMVVMHTCNNPLCVNPAHLSEGTHLENTQQMLAEGRHNVPSGDRHYQAAKTHCPLGHPYNGDNLIVKQGKRVCRECYNRQYREYCARKRDRGAT